MIFLPQIKKSSTDFFNSFYFLFEFFTILEILTFENNKLAELLFKVLSLLIGFWEFESNHSHL